MNQQAVHALLAPLLKLLRVPTLIGYGHGHQLISGQLAAELPVYLGLLHRGFAVFVRRLVAIQTRFWVHVKNRWADLWEMLRVERELYAGWEEMCAVWCGRWADVDEVMRALGLMQPGVLEVLKERKKREEPQQRREMEVEYFGMPGFY